MRWWTLFFLGGLPGIGVSHSQDLPPPPTPEALAAQPDHDLYLQLIINQSPAGRIIAVRRTGNDYWVRPADLGDLSLPGPPALDERINLSAIPDLHVHYDTLHQQLELTVPAHWIARQHLGGERPSYEQARSGSGASLSYTLHTQSATGSRWHSSLWHDARAFGKAGTWRSTGVYRHARKRNPGSTHRGYMRYETTWHYADQKRMLIYEAGDVITRTPSWGRSIRLGGVQVFRNFALRPDLVTFPVPEFSGTAELPSTVELFINGIRQQQHRIGPGPFTVTERSSISGSGEATLITEDIQGRRVSTTLPFYATTQLLKPGLTSFSASAGVIRRDFGLHNARYGTAAGNAAFRTGVTRWLTVAAYAELSRPVQLAGASATVRLGRLGLVELAFQRSQSRTGSGNAYDASYQYQHRRFSLGARYQHRQAHFHALADVADRRNPLPGDARTHFQLTGGFSLGDWGSLGLGYFDIRGSRTSGVRMWNAFWQRSLSHGAHLSLSLNKTIGHNWSAVMQLSITPGHRLGTATLTTERYSNAHPTSRIQSGRRPSASGGWGWNMAVQQRHRRPPQLEASVAQQTRIGSWQAGIARDDRRNHYFGEVTGSLAFMDGRGFLANEIRDGFVVVSTNGVAGIPVLYENQNVGKTDRQGYLLVPMASAYYPGKYEINALSLPAGVQVSTVEQRVAVKSQSGYVMRFPVRQSRTATFQLIDETGQALPPGSRITTPADNRFFVGLDGQTYIENLSGDTLLTVHLPDGRDCQAWLALPDTTEPLQPLAPVTCQ